MQFRDGTLSQMGVWNSSFYCTPPYPLYLMLHCAGTNENTTKYGTIPALCVSLLCWCCVFCLVRGTPTLVRVGSWNLTSKERYCLTRHDRDPEYGSNAWICLSQNRDLESGWLPHESDTGMQGHQVVGHLSCAVTHPVHPTRVTARTSTSVTDLELDD